MKKYFLFMSSGMSLSSWEENGSLDREFSFIKGLSEINKIDIYIISYSKKDAKFSRITPKNVHIILPLIESNNSIIWRLNYFYWPFAIRKACQRNSNIIYRSNQISGSIAIFIANLIIRGKIILRCGYVKSLFEDLKGNYIKGKIYKIYERFMINKSDKIIVSNEKDRDYFQLLTSKKININRNYIIEPSKKLHIDKRISDRILFVGRLRHQKNLYSIIKACHNSGFGLDIVGDGEIYEELKSYVHHNNFDVCFYGNIPFNEISNNFYSNYKYCILCSYFEGTPKTLLEALSHECIPIANKQSINKAVPGIENFLPQSRCLDSQSIQKYITRITNLNHNIPFDDLIKPFKLENFIRIEQSIINE